MFTPLNPLSFVLIYTRLPVGDLSNDLSSEESPVKLVESYPPDFNFESKKRGKDRMFVSPLEHNHVRLNPDWYPQSYMYVTSLPIAEEILWFFKVKGIDYSVYAAQKFDDHRDHKIVERYSA